MNRRYASHVVTLLVLATLIYGLAGSYQPALAVPIDTVVSVTCTQAETVSYEGIDQATSDPVFAFEVPNAYCAFTEMLAVVDETPETAPVVITVDDKGVGSGWTEEAFLTATLVYPYEGEPVMLKPHESETKPPEEIEMRQAAQAFIDYMTMIEETHPDPTEEEQIKIVQDHGEEIASLYCQASGLPIPCQPPEDPNAPTADGKALGIQGINWWDWLYAYVAPVAYVGVIPATPACPAGISLVEIYHDDEDSSNANSRWGWIGATVSDRNTRFRFCRVPSSFRPILEAGSAYDYAVLQLSLSCPSGSHSMWRYFDNEDSNNANSGSGPYFPNVNVGGRNWQMKFCVFDDSQGAQTMTSFPSLGFTYGVFAPLDMPAPYNLWSGYLYKDDEDSNNQNSWTNGPDSMMGGGRNTWMTIANVRDALACGIPAYAPAYWNDHGTIQYNNNCYNYANNKRTDTFAQPGRGGGSSAYPYSSISCSTVYYAARADGLVSPASNGTCRSGEDKLALAVAPGWDYHWYRRDSSGWWSHKPGGTSATNLDNSGNPISNPQTANRGPYTNFCGYLCACSDTVQGQGHEYIR